jgi:hypothetical protein
MALTGCNKTTSSSPATSSESSTSPISQSTTPSTPTSSQYSLPSSFITSNPDGDVPLWQHDALRAKSLAETMWKNYYDEDVNAAYEYYPYRDDTQELSSVWHYTSIMSLYIKLMKLFPDDALMKGRLSLVADGLEFYRENRSDYRVYAVNRASKKNGVIPGINTNVYDDNEWIAREFLNAYEATNNAAYLTASKELITYILEKGWDYTINSATGQEWGGIYWGPYYLSKHTCSNGPIINTLVRLSKLDNETKIHGRTYLEWAKLVYTFAYNTFRRADGIYGDMIGTTRDLNGNTISHGSLDNTAYTYNTGSMITAGALLYGVTQEKHYLDEALLSAKASFTYFGDFTIWKGLVQFPVSTTLWFNLVLFEGYYFLYQVDKENTKAFFDEIQASLDFCYNNYLYQGLLPSNWLLGWIFGLDKDAHQDVMDVTADAETYALLALKEKL